MLSIGEFSRVTRLTVKALRLYHEKGLLVPDLRRPYAAQPECMNIPIESIIFCARAGAGPF